MFVLGEPKEGTATKAVPFFYAYLNLPNRYSISKEACLTNANKASYSPMLFGKTRQPHPNTGTDNLHR